MPNRKTFDQREKYDHSGHPLEGAQPNDLKPDISESDEERDPRGSASPRRPAASAGKPRPWRRKPPGRPG